MKNLWLNQGTNETIDNKAVEIALGISSQISGLASPNPNVNGSQNIKRTFEELDYCVGLESKRFAGNFDLKNAALFSEIKSSTKKLKVVQEIVKGLDANVVNVRKRIDFTDEREIKALVQKQFCSLESHVEKVEDSVMKPEVVDFIITNHACYRDDILGLKTSVVGDVTFSITKAVEEQLVPLCQFIMMVWTTFHSNQTQIIPGDQLLSAIQMLETAVNTLKQRVPTTHQHLNAESHGHLFGGAEV